MNNDVAWGFAIGFVTALIIVAKFDRQRYISSRVKEPEEMR